MIDLYKVGENPYDDEHLSVEKLLPFTEEHLSSITSDPVAGEVSLELTAVNNALDALGVSLSSEDLKIALRKARVQAKNTFRATLPSQISRIYGSALEAYTSTGDGLTEIFGEGREVFSDCKDALLGGKLLTLSTAVIDHVDDLSPAMQTLANALVTTWTTVYGASTAAKGVVGGQATDRRTSVQALRNSLGQLRLALGSALFKQPDRLKSLFPQHLLGEPLDPAKPVPATPTPTP